MTPLEAGVAIICLALLLVTCVLCGVFSVAIQPPQ